MTATFWPDAEGEQNDTAFLPEDVEDGEVSDLTGCLATLSVTDHCLRSTNYVNVIVADKAPHLQYIPMDLAIDHCTKGINMWDFASNDEGAEPDVVMACAGDIPTSESISAVAILRGRCPGLKIRFVNIVDLFP